MERTITGDHREHNIDDMPYEKPWRLAAGVAVFTFASTIGFAGSDDIQAKVFHIDVETLMIFYRFMAFAAPVAFGLLALTIAYEVRARLESKAGHDHVRRATLRRNAKGGFDEEPSPEPV